MGAIPGSHPTDQALSGLGALRFDPERSLALAVRCMTTPDADGGLDRDIHDYLNPPRQASANEDEPPPGFGRGFLDGDYWGAEYTWSIDGAVSLIPAEYESRCFGCTDDGRGYAELAGHDGFMMAQDPEEFYVEADAATIPLAICAAAFKARAAIAMETRRAETTGSVGEADDSAAIAQKEVR